jgi:GNAT superfamily N-acetyltransferase
MSIKQISSKDMEDYSKIPISFEVKSILHVSHINQGLGGIQLIEQNCTTYVKNYDEIDEVHPLNWSKFFNLEEWGIFVIHYNDIYIGGATVTPPMSKDKKVAVLWDLRIHPDFRGQGLGKDLLKVVYNWVNSNNYSRLIVETQNINVSACKFYSKMGFILGTIDINGYYNSEVAHETKLLWYLDF